MSRRRSLYLQQTQERAALLVKPIAEVIHEKASEDQAPQEAALLKKRAEVPGACRYCGKELKRGKWLHEKHCSERAGVG